MTSTIRQVFTGKDLCGFCRTGNHDLCPRVIVNGSKDIGTHLLRCPCDEEICNTLRCYVCRNERASDLDPETWTCTDRDACEARVQKRLDDNPLIQRITESKERAMAEKQAKQQETKAKAAPKEGKCIVTGKPTKGGKFAPGMDARYVSNQVAAVMSGEKSKTAAIKEFKDNDLSDTLIAKFEKGLGLAQEREAKKKEAAKAKADAKAEAKKAKAAEAAA